MPHGCKCGYYTDPRRECRCTPREIQNYRSRISGPLLDRIDIHVDVPPVEYQELASDRAGEPSATIRERIVPARAIQVERFRGERFFTNARMDMRHVRKHCMLDGDGQMLVRQAMESLGLSARAYGKILKVSRTIADLEGCEQIQSQHVSEAVNYRTLERTLE